MTRQRRRNIIRARRTGTGIALVAAISFIAGMTDAVGLYVSGDFVSFMTGNTTRAAVSMQAGIYSHAVKLLFAIVAFVLGNAGGIVVAHKFDRSIFAVLAAVGSLVAIAALLRNEAVLAQFYLVVFAMGMVNAAVEHIEGLPIGLTYVTGALSRFGRGIGRFLLGDRSLDWSIQIVPWLGMISGAISGAVLGATLQSDALWVVAATVFAVAIATLVIPRSLRHRYNQRVRIRRIAP
ncbi:MULTISPECIES: YoaK family protein [Rhizobium]|uniref:Membrane protein n=1 Tax=Rhizobium nepotum 39/7 TaxID=1368418 RepID=A0ABR5CVI0_9HYPH|nr:YoaK family protein [Rhizobium nepotum]KJF68837.1 membrane protein [Rhizobium nepotum 39/7]